MNQTLSQRPWLITLAVWIAAFVVTGLAVLAYAAVPLGLLETSMQTRMLFSPMELMLVPVFVVLLAASTVLIWLVTRYASSRAMRNSGIVAVALLTLLGLPVAALAARFAYLPAITSEDFSLAYLTPTPSPTFILLFVVPLLGPTVYAVRTERPGIGRLLAVQALAFAAGVMVYAMAVILVGSEA